MKPTTHPPQAVPLPSQGKAKGASPYRLLPHRFSLRYDTTFAQRTSLVRETDISRTHRVLYHAQLRCVISRSLKVDISRAIRESPLHITTTPSPFDMILRPPKVNISLRPSGEQPFTAKSASNLSALALFRFLYSVLFCFTPLF